MSQNRIDSKKLISRIFDPDTSGKLKKQEGSKSIESTPLKSGPGFFQAIRAGFENAVYHNEFAGIDVGGDSIKFILLSKKSKGICIKDYQVEPLQKLSDGSQPEDPMKEVVNCLVKISSRIKPKTRVGISVYDQSVFLGEMAVPKGTNEEVRESIKKEMSDQHLIDPKTNFFDYIPEQNSDNASSIQKLFLVAIPRELIYRQFEVVQSAGFRVLSIETNPLASWQALLRTERWEKNERVVILDVGARFTSLLIVAGQRILFGRLIPIAGNRFSVALSEKLNCNFSKAEELKKTYGLSAISKAGIKESNLSDEAFAVSGVLLDEINKLLAEVNRSLQFSFSKEVGSEGGKVHRAYLLGGSSDMTGFREYVCGSLNVDINPIDLWKPYHLDEKFKTLNGFDKKKTLSPVALGLALKIDEWAILPFGLGMP
ncbi:MAG: hypothetical protein A3G33_03555 [Omnitrophica bacterium RIFCSPLOWO2_12_FULL_44_17]|uniref:SHS2 domain-containing protein n=1 Tax=Candidatus Danuiimicrobium aquiferis TaxID=1801832 RepID=A0A1G1KTY7_9BACT|nr:MAG: hypothetical protein A3B72_07100 [Omnitrophica bacterium RIFCSPHIGHO2_02_FULL_45_28]OGW88723.1 MAG: hypothetical protein A3E74_05215 [Omnitrophica bacterium RIFCSPHIGHO2_12_FULL_44_12]OGW96391.1 MAG: hypothetical protein A3G33_03555 [Omnitrophica bacterium RIFCSPLOWO2_12_FULL_44_17]OGX04803.1 MAG: hypothetical protein A3J12_07575 [Omnitrophica bacterium RIFCSPLOWO2_02_FULL_44_11]